ncbi:MAG: hypothetical protein HQK89_09710 [Nitrospirae bacterium]|nr:hypothetical protein [Nitrospirota bacterium]
MQYEIFFDGRSRFTIRSSASLEEMKADEPQYWQQQPAHVRMDAVEEITREAYGLKDSPSNKRSFDDLKELGAGVPAPDGIVSLYRQAFRDFGARSLWSRKPGVHPTIAQVLVIADALRREGSMETLPLAAQIEEACRASL